LVVLGDWERKYERMGEVEGEGILRGGGVCGIVGEAELAESDDADETDNERDLLRGPPMGMGSERMLCDFSSEDI
jgi:hypothetical protein